MVLCPNTWSQRWVRLWRPLGAREPAARGGAIFLTREAREPSGRAQAASSAASAPARQPWQLSFKMFQGKTKIVPRASTIFICHDSWVATSFSPSMRHSTIHRTFWIFSCSKLFSWIQHLVDSVIEAEIFHGQNNFKWLRSQLAVQLTWKNSLLNFSHLSRFTMVLSLNVLDFNTIEKRLLAWILHWTNRVSYSATGELRENFGSLPIQRCCPQGVGLANCNGLVYDCTEATTFFSCSGDGRQRLISSRCWWGDTAIAVALQESSSECTG